MSMLEDAEAVIQALQEGCETIPDVAAARFMRPSKVQAALYDLKVAGRIVRIGTAPRNGKGGRPFVRWRAA